MSKPSPPPSPNYQNVAQQQGTANSDAARNSAVLSNPNIISPYGNQTVSWGNPASGVTAGAPSTGSLDPHDIQFQYIDPTGQWHSQNVGVSPSDLNGQASPVLQSILNGGNRNVQAMIGGQPYNMGNAVPGGGNLWTNPRGGADQSLYNLVFGAPGGTPTAGAAQFDSTGQPILQPTVTQTLNPVSQAALNQQQQAELGLSTLANNQTAKIAGILDKPFSFSGTPQTQVDPNSRVPNVATPLSPDYFQQTSGAGGQYASPQLSPNLFSFGSAQGMAPGTGGPINSGPSAGQFGMAHGGVNAPNLQTSLNTAGVNPVNQGFDPSRYGQAGGVNTSGVAPMPVTPGMTGQQAIESRLAPQQARDLTSYQTQLINQGLRPGDEAYNNAMTVFQQGQNDAQTQAALYGLNLDMSANQQGFGQAATSAQLGNQAIAQNAGMGLTGANFGNAAQQQAFNEAVQSGQFGNQAQLASFGAGLQNQQAGNQAIQQNFGQALAAQQGQNAAQGQGFSQAESVLGSQNQAIAQNQATAQAQQQAYNAALAQGFSQAEAMQAARNAAVQQNFSNYGTQNQLQNQSQQQLYNELLQSGQFANTAQAQAFQQQFQNYNAPINAITALLSGGQIQAPQFQQYTGQTIQPAPIMQGAQNQANFDQQTYQQQMASHNALMGGLFSLGAAPFSMFNFGGKH